jgi:NAD(P)H-dependent FMN reductase
MYTIIAGTNREGSNTLKVAKEYQNYFKSEGVEAQLFSLKEITMLHRDEAFEKLEAKYITPTTKFIFVMPEYNGVFPGIFKLMIDMTEIKPSWNDKKVMLVGLASGRAGNLRGLDAMTNMCNYMKMQVLPNKIPLSGINNELKGDVFIQEGTIQAIKQQIQEFISF